MSLTRINNNISSLNAQRNLVSTNSALAKSLERLSSGLRINRAADDAAGLTISENLRTQINGLNQAIDNASSAINLVNTAEGALIETTNRLQRVRVLAVQAANTGTNDSVALQAIQDEIETSISEITRIGNDTQFANRRLINGDNAAAVTFRDGTNNGISLSNSPVASSLSSGARFLKIDQTNAGSETLATGDDGVNNSGATTFTGSTFDSGTYDLVVGNVVAASTRVVSIDMSINTPAAANLNGTTFTSDGGSHTVATNDVMVFSGLNSDGDAWTYTFTAIASFDGGGLATNIQTAVRAATTGNTDTVAYNSTTGTWTLTADGMGESTATIGLTIDSLGGGAPVEFAAGAEVTAEGSDNTAVVSIAGGPAQTVTAGDTVTLEGITPSDVSQTTPQITMTLGSTLTEGTDSLTIVAQQYSGALEGGQSVTFQNGDRNVRFRSGTGGGFASGETVSLDFDATINLSGGTSRTFVLSAVDNSLNFQVGANQNQRVKVAFGDLRADQLGYVGDTQANGNDKTVAGINVTTLTGANEAISIVDEALNQVSQQRSALGAFTNRLEATISNLGVASENLTASESRIRDADIAAESARFTRNQILLQAGISVAAQSNLAPQSVLALLT